MTPPNSTALTVIKHVEPKVTYQCHLPESLQVPGMIKVTQTETALLSLRPVDDI